MEFDHSELQEKALLWTVSWVLWWQEDETVMSLEIINFTSFSIWVGNVCVMLGESILILKHLDLKDGGRMLLWKIGSQLQDHMLWKLAKQLNETQCHGIPDSVHHVLQFVIILLNLYHYNNGFVIADCKKYRGNVVLVHAVKAHRGSRGEAPLILSFSRWGGSFMRCPL